MRQVLIVVLAVFAFGGAAPARPGDVQSPPRTIEELDARIASLLKKGEVPGASVVLIEKGGIAWAKDYGYADAAAKRPVTPETMFRAGSISKTWTSLAIMMLVEEGKVNLDAKLRDILPEFQFDNPWEASDPVRLVHLLEHTTGFDDFAFEKYMLEGADVPLSRAVELYGPYRSRWKPGTRMAYCNAGPVIAGWILEKVTGQTFEAFMAERLLEPMGLESARWIRTPDIAARLSKSYKGASGAEIKYYEILARPAGSLNITARDLAALPVLMLAQGAYQGRRYLTPQSIARMETPKTTDGARLGFNAGAGLGVLSEPAKRKVRVYGHDGGIDGFNAAYRYAPDAQAGYVIMMNRLVPEVYDAREEIMAYVLRGVPEPVVRSKPVSPEQAADWAGFYQAIAPRIQKLTVIEDLLAIQSVAFENGTAKINDEPQTHLGGGRFRIAGSAQPSYLIHDAKGETRLEYVGGVARKLVGWEVASRMAYAGAFAIALIGSIIYALIWIPSAALGRLQDRGGAMARLLPALSVFAIAAAFATLASILIRDDLEELAAPTLWGWTLAALTIAIPALALLSAAVLVLRRSDLRWLPWLMGWGCVAVAAVATAYLVAYGAIGFRLWT